MNQTLSDYITSSTFGVRRGLIAVRRPIRQSRAAIYAVIAGSCLTIHPSLHAAKAYQAEETLVFHERGDAGAPREAIAV